MKTKLGFLLVLLLPTVAFATGFPSFQLADTGEVCYSWEGGHKSAGSFSRCQPVVQVAVLQPMAPPPAPMVMSSPVCPPQVILEPEPRKHRPIRKPRPKAVCK